MSSEGSICDVVSEKVPYCRTNSVIQDQLFSHFCDSIVLLKTRRERQMFVMSDTAHYARRLIRAYDMCSAIRYFFEDDVTIMTFAKKMGSKMISQRRGSSCGIQCAYAQIVYEQRFGYEH